MLIPTAQSTFLVQGHITYLSFIHAVVVGSDFLEQHGKWLEALQNGRQIATWDWIALCKWKSDEDDRDGAHD